MHPYVPSELPLGTLDHQLLLPSVAKANAALARYDGLLQGLPNPAVMLSPLTTTEAVLSSKIEGTQVTVDEVLEHEAGLLKTGEKSEDIREIANYRSALYAAQAHLEDYPIRLALVRQLHQILMDSVRGMDKTPGEFRSEQNWIGRAGCTIEEASFIPPSPLQLTGCLQKWEAYIDGDEIDILVQAAIVHAQFELLHPFKDGNGRIGRILIPLFLFQKRALSQPVFYLSEYLESHRDEYYHQLGAISQDGNWNGWIVFFLEAIATQAGRNSTRVKAIQALYEEMKLAIQAATRSQYTVQILDTIFTKPILQTSDPLFVQSGIPKNTMPGLIRQMKDAAILRELKPASGRRPATLCFPRLINLAEGHEVV